MTAHQVRSAVMDVLARVARPLALVSALALIVGVTLTGLNLLLGGWTVYAAGHVLAIAAFGAIWAANRSRLDAWATLGLLVLLTGMVLALPQVAAIWQVYLEPICGLTLLNRCGVMELPVWTAPVGLTAELVTWVGLAFFGLAARGAQAMARGIGWVMAGAALIGILAALYIVSPYAWVAAMLLFGVALLSVGVSMRESASADPLG